MQAKLDHTKIDMSLYKASKEPPPKIIPIGDETKGSVHIMIKYESTTGILIVRLNEVKYYKKIHGFEK